MARIPFYSDLVNSLPPQLRRLAKDYFVYRAEYLPILASETDSFAISIQADSDFIIAYITGVVTETNNTTFLDPNQWPFLVRLFDSGQGRQLSDGDVHLGSLVGTAEEPSYLPYPHKLRAGGTLTVNLQNLSAVDRNVRLFFHGFKLFAIPEEGYEEETIPRRRRR